MKYKGLFLYSRATLRNGSQAFDWLRSEAAGFGIALDIRFFEDAGLEYGTDYLLRFGAERIEIPHFVVVRGYDCVLSRHFELQGIPVINTSASMEVSRNKMLTHQLLAQHAVPTPRTAGGNRYRYADLSELFHSNAFVVKQTDGSKGEHVFLVDSPESFAVAVRNCRGNCIFQEFVETSAGKDLRVWVIGDRVAGHMLRYSEHSFISNFSRGGKVAPVEIDPEIERLAVESARLTGLEFAGVDILFGRDGGYAVCEINGNAGFRSLSGIPGANIPYRLFEYIRGRYLR